MSLKAVVDSLDAVPEALHEFYTQGYDGKFRLSAEGIEFEDRVKGLKTALEKERRAARDAMAKLKQYEGVDPEEYQRLKEAAEKAEEERRRKEGDFEALLKQHQEKHAKELGKKDERITMLTRALESALIDAEASKAISDEGGSVVLLLPHVRGRARMVEEDGTFRVEILRTDATPMMGDKGERATFKDLVKELKASDEYGRAFASSGASGGGSRSGGASGGSRGSGKNPWLPDHFNLTEQGRILRENPALAAQFKAEAGVA